MITPAGPVQPWRVTWARYVRLMRAVQDPNCFRCSGTDADGCGRLLIMPGADRCTWRRVAENDLQKLRTGQAPITLTTMWERLGVRERLELLKY